MQAFFDERELLAILALAGAAFWMSHHHVRINLSALKAAIVWDLAEAGRIQAESDAIQFGATLNLQDPNAAAGTRTSGHSEKL